MKKHSSIFFKITTLAVLLTSMIGGAFAQTPSDEGTHNVTVASSCGSYTWSANGVSYHASGVYTYAYENESGYASVDTLKLTIKPVPNVEVDGNDTVCFGVISGLKATGATTYWWWHTGNGMAAPINSVPKDSITVTLTEVDTFIVVGTNSYGCQATDTFPVLVLPLPSVVAHAHTSRICRGYSVTLTAEGAHDYIWRPGNLFGQPVEAWPKRTTTYTVTGYDLFGCKNTASVTVEVEGVGITADKTQMCDGDTATLTASGAGAYSWELDDGTYTEDDWQGTESIRVTRPGTYIVTGIGHGMGCTSKDTVTITVYDLPEVRITGPEVVNGGDTICKGDTAMLIANGADVYSWTIDGTVAHADTIMVFPTVNKKYLLLGEDTLTKCKAKDSVEVVVHALPEVKITGRGVINGRDTICKGDTTMLVGEGAKYYSWSESYLWTNSMETKDSIKISPVANISYIVTGTDTNKCKAKDTVNVVVNALPEVRITGPNVVNGQDTICKGDTTMLAGNGAKYYTWDQSYIWTNSVDTKDSIKISPKENIRYIVTGTDTNKCKAKDTVNVVVHELPEVTITGPTVVDGRDTICKGDTTMLVANGADKYTWSEPYIWTSSEETKESVKISPKEDIQYIVTGEDAHKCKAKDTVDVTVLALPDVRITGPNVVDGRDTICKGDTTMLIGEGAKYYSWNQSYIWTSSVETKDSIKISPKVNTKYIVTGIDTIGKCKAKDTVDVIVNALPEVKITGPDVVNGQDTICKGDTTLLIGEGAKYYSWNRSYIWTSSVETKDSIKISPVANVKYIVTGTDTNKCKAKDTVNVVVNTLPEVSITGPTVVNGRDTLCHGDTSMYIASGAKFYDWVEVIKGESYIWTSSVERKDTILISPPGSTLKYVVTGTDTNKCKSKDTVDVIVYPKPHVGIDGDDDVCKGKELSLGTTTTSHDWPIDEYKWSTGDDEDHITVSPTEDTEYEVKVTDIHGCTATATKTVSVHDKPNVEINGDDVICTGETTTLSVSATSGMTFVWITPSGTEITGVTSIDVSPTETSEYKLIATNEYGCSDTVSKTITVADFSVSISAPTDHVCEGNSVVITANASREATFDWTDMANAHIGTSASISVSGSIPFERYTVTATDNLSGCTITATQVVYVNNLSLLQIGGKDKLCPGGTVTLTATGADTYRWSSGQTTASITVTSAGTYSVTGTDAHGCTGTAAKSVSVRDLAIVTINSSNDKVCPGESVTLTATSTGSYSYEWSNGQTSASITVDAAGIYSVTGTDDNDCSVSASKMMTAGTTPRISITGPDGICYGTNSTLTAVGVSNCIWKDTSDNTLGSAPQLQIAPTEHTTYLVYGEVSGNSCIGFGNKYVRVNPLPEISILADSLICEGGDVMLRAVSYYPGLISYEWPGYGSGSSITVTQSDPQLTYTLIGITRTDGLECRAAATKIIRTRKGVGHNEPVRVCGRNYHWRGQVFFDSGTYISPFPTLDENGCQSYDTLQLTLDDNTGNVVPITESEYYRWDRTGDTYYYSGTYTSAEYVNNNGCWTADTLKLTIINDEVFHNDCMIYGFMVREESCDPGHDGVVKLSVDEAAVDDFDIEWNMGNGQVATGLTVGGLSKGEYPVKVKSRTCPNVVYYEDVIKVTREEDCEDDDDDDDDDDGDDGDGPTVTISGPTFVPYACGKAPKCTYYVTVTGGTPPYNTSASYTFSFTPSGHCVLTRSATDSRGKTGTGTLDVYGKKLDCPHDPNLITGPEGYTEEKHFVNATDKMNYRIDFENDPDFATSPATRVKVTYDVPAEQNLGSFRLGDFGFGSFIYTVPSNVNSYYQRIDVSDSLGVWVDVTAGMDIVNHQLFWIFQSIDPATGAEPVSSQMGFLPVNDSLNRGEGYVSYYIAPKNTVVTGDTVAAQAVIIFDENESIPTNVYVNTFDAVAPTSTLIAEMNEQDSLYCTFTFDAQDDANGSGVKEVEVFVSKNSGTYRSLGITTPDSSLSYTLESGMYYQFVSIATDNVGNKEPFKAVPDTVVNYNTAPIELMLSGTTFYEYDPQYTLIGTFSTVDDNMSQPFVYTLVSGEGDDDNALFMIDGDMLKTDTTFVCSQELDYFVRVRTTDFGGLYCERSFKLSEIRQHITPTTKVPMAICEGESYDFHGTELTTAGSYSSTLQTSEGCDSIVILFLTVNPSYDITLDTIVCDEFVWNDSIYTESDTISYTYTLATGCDSTVTYNLTVNYSTEGVDEQIACDSYTWINDSTYTESTTIPTVTLTNAVGCDSVVTLHLTINHSTEGVDEQIACNSFTWIDDSTYTVSTNTPTVTLTNAAGCDSVVTLHLTINQSTEGVDEQIACNSFTWIDDSTYTVSTNTPTVTLTNAAGCDSVVTLHLTINHSTEGVDEQIACNSYTWIDDITYTESTNTPTVTLTNAAGCDSIVTLHLTINHSTEGVDEQIACNSYTWIDDITYTESTNTPTVTLTNAAGCDSVVILHLTINHSTEGIDEQIACDNYTWINDSTYTVSTNTPTVTLTNAAGCDSVVTLHLTVNYGTHNVYDTVVCESYEWHGAVYTVSGTYTYTYEETNADGCVAVDTLHLIVNYGMEFVDEQVACESFTWINDSTYTESTNIPTVTLTNAAGCDSVVTLHLTINHPTTGIDLQEACESYTWIDGVTYTASTTTPTFTIEGGAANGCDSTVTLHLTINQPTTGIDEQVACETFTWIDGVTYTASTSIPTYTYAGGAANGCDSTVTLHLTINQPTTGIDEQVACESYTWIDDVTYTASTSTPTYTYAGGAANGCDSTVTLHLTINQP
ncbi:MAG: hypothetical protein IKP54_10665, partial [Bacteroidales bacterium]|nr:hypothetical protein [Bacteroidales bacterium]